jgi:hypothetical protein
VFCGSGTLSSSFHLFLFFFLHLDFLFAHFFLAVLVATAAGASTAASVWTHFMCPVGIFSRLWCLSHDRERVKEREIMRLCAPFLGVFCVVSFCFLIYFPKRTVRSFAENSREKRAIRKTKKRTLRGSVRQESVGLSALSFFLSHNRVVL